jgi:hypothetical protein
MSANHRASRSVAGQRGLGRAWADNGASLPQVWPRYGLGLDRADLRERGFGGFGDFRSGTSSCKLTSRIREAGSFGFSHRDSVAGKLSPSSSLDLLP